MSWQCSDPDCKQENSDSSLVCGRCNKSQYGPVVCNYHFEVPDSEPFSHAANLLEQVLGTDAFKKLKKYERKSLAEWIYSEIEERGES